MKARIPKSSLILALLCVFGQRVSSAELPAGKVVWWGSDVFWNQSFPDHTNGVIEYNDEIATNIIAVAAGSGVALALKNDGTVIATGLHWPGVTEMPTNLNDIVSITAAGDSYWAVRSNGTVARWGSLAGDQDSENIISDLTNIASISFAGGGNVGAQYLAIKKNGTVVGFCLGDPERKLPLVKAHGETLSNVVTIVPMGHTPLMLNSNGMVYSLGYQRPSTTPAEPRYEVHSNILYEYPGGESANLPYQYVSPIR